MNKNLRTAPLLPCPHCARELHQGSPYVAHVRVCIANPALFAAVRAKLADGSGGIVRPGAYNLRRGDLPSAGGLRNQVAAMGGPDSWPAVAARFGLKPMSAKRWRWITRLTRRGVEMDAAMDAAQAQDAAEADEAQAARLPSGLVVARVVVGGCVIERGDGWARVLVEERYLLR